MRHLLVGEQVTVNVNQNKHYKAGYAPGMENYHIVTIRRINNLVVDPKEVLYEILEDGGMWRWSADMFLETQIAEEAFDLVPIETYVEVNGIGIDNVYLLKITKHYPAPGNKYAVCIMSTDGDANHRPNVGVSFNLPEATEVIIPTNEYLFKRWGVKNAEIKKEKNPIDFFKNSKYPVKNITIVIDGKKHNGYSYILDDSKSPGKSGIKSIAYTEDNKLLIRRDIKTQLNMFSAFSQKDAVIELCKAKVVSCDESIAMFLHRAKKQEMFRASTEEKKTFDITNIIYDYEKNGEKCHVIEVFDGEISLKFKLSDIEIVYPNLNGIQLPKDRTISKGVICKVSNNKHLPVSRNSTVTVLEMTNISRPRKDYQKYNKSTIVKVVTDDNKVFNCKIKNLKKIKDGIIEKTEKTSGGAYRINTI